MSEHDNDRQRRDFNRQMHVNINHRQARLRKASGEWEHWLYEAKTLTGEIGYLTKLFAKERTGLLPDKMKYCSMSPTESVPENTLLCCLGVEPKKCPILLETFHGMETFPPEMIDAAKASVCVTHILTDSAKGGWVDTSEGYVTDATERAFWNRTYEGMAANGPDEGDGLRCPNCGDNDWETWYLKAPWFKQEESGTQPGTPDGPPVHWAQGDQTCPMCKHVWFVQASS